MLNIFNSLNIIFILIGIFSINEPFSVAMLVYWRVTSTNPTTCQEAHWSCCPRKAWTREKIRRSRDLAMKSKRVQLSRIVIHMDLYGFIWVYMDLYGIYKYGFMWFYMECIWIYMDFYGIKSVA